jgi:hypothetical protein
MFEQMSVRLKLTAKSLTWVDERGSVTVIRPIETHDPSSCIDSELVLVSVTMDVMISVLY